MIARWDIIVAFGLATGVHVAGLGYYAATGGFEGSGAEGRASLSLQAAPESIADLVATWEAVPEISPVVDALDAPVVEEAFAKLDAWSDSAVPMVTTKLEDAPDVAKAPVVEMTAVPQLATLVLPAQTAPQVTQDLNAPRLAAPIMPAMKPPALAFEPLSVGERAVVASTRPAKRPDQSTRAPAIVARGTGGDVSAGNLGVTRAVAVMAPAARTAVQAAWATKIQSRIARHQKFPRGARGNGRVRLHMDIMADGRLGSVQIDRSSGVAAFDRAALRAAKAAAPFPAAPKELSKARYGFAQWVNFSR